MTQTGMTHNTRMALIRSRDTKPEMAVRKCAHGLGFRYRLHRKDLPGRPDLVFPARKSVVFVHGCFWHGHDCRAGKRSPKSNVAYWTNKIAGNSRRDVESISQLESMGWRVLIIWECETKDRHAVGTRLSQFLCSPTSAVSPDTT